jgi:choline dehydrogenase
MLVCPIPPVKLPTHLLRFSRAQYGSPEDFDEWAKVIGDDTWSWKNIAQYVRSPCAFRAPLLMKSRYFNKFERFQPHPDYPSVDSSVRGSSGPVRIGYHNTITDTSKAFIRACANVGIPFIHDFHGTLSTIGVSRVSYYSSLFHASI